MKEGLKYPVLFLAAAVSWLFVNGLGLQNQKKEIQMVMAILLIVCLLVILFLKRKQKLTKDGCIRVILLMGCVMRIGYMLYTPCTLRSHDLWEPEPDATGKAGYLLHILLEGRLPESNELQLYQQPFFFLAGAICSKILNAIIGNGDVFLLVDGAKVVSCFASCATMFVAEKLFAEFEVGKQNTAYGMLLIAFTPVFYLTGGRMGEDALCLFFIASALLYTLYWKKEPTWKNTCILALLYGFGMMTKISCAVPALYTLWVMVEKLFIKKLAVKEKEKNVWKLLFDKENRLLYGKLVVFGCISLPLGLWYSLRNWRLFGQGLTYVLPQDVEGPLFTGKVSLMQRFIIPDMKNLLQTPYANPIDDSNMPVYLLKSELFGEFSYEITPVIPTILLFLNLLLTVVAVSFGILLLVRRKQIKGSVVPAVWLLLFGVFAINSYFSYPFGCTMDFRYYMMLSVIKALLIGKLLQGAGLGKESDENVFLREWVKKGCILFGIFSCLMYCLV